MKAEILTILISLIAAFFISQIPNQGDSSVAQFQTFKKDFTKSYSS